MSALSAMLSTRIGRRRKFGEFLANVLRYVRYMLSAVRLSSVCRLTSVCLSSVCDVGAPYSAG